jgi:intein/homing endonuclease
MTLNNKTGEKEWQLPMGGQVYDNGNNDMYKIELVDENGKESELVVSEEHKVYVSKESLGKILMFDEDNTINLPLNSDGLNVLNNLLREYCNESIKGGFISKNIIPNDSFGGNLSLFKKSLSLVNITRCSDLALSNIFGSLDFNLTRTILNPLLDSDLIKPTGMFSSAMNEISLCNKSLIFNSFGSQFETCKNSFSTEFRIIFFKNFFNCYSCTKESYNIFDKDSSISKCQISTTNLSVCNNIIININFHCKVNENNEIFKLFYIEEEVNLSNFKLQQVTETYEDINNGKEIYFLDSENNPIRVKSITKEQYNGKIYDVDVENDIVLVRRENKDGELGRVFWSGNSNPQPTQIEVYAKDTDTLIATFENITTENWHKIYLTNLTGSQDTFDLKIVNGEVEFDYIVDPTIAPPQIVKESVLTDVIAEKGAVNFTHLNISATAPYDSLVGYWNFDGDKENTLLTTHYDFTGNNNDGTGVGNAKVNSSNCVYDGCLHLLPSTDYVSLASSSSFNSLDNNMSISFWVYRNSVSPSYQDVFAYFISSSTDNIELKTYNNRLYLENDIDDVGSSQSLASSFYSRAQWVHVVYVFNDTSWEGYINGTSKGSQVLAAPFGNLDDGFTVRFGRGLYTSQNLNGSMDEIMIFNTSLTSAQILNIYNNQSARFKTTGTQSFGNQSVLGISAGNNRVNVTTDFEAKFGSKLSLSVGYYDGVWSYTAAQNLTSGSVHSFSTSSTTTNLTLNYTFIAGNQSNPFYTPILNGSITFEAWNEAEASTGKGGLINTTAGATPFYTNESNPRNISLGVGENQLVIFWINATGAVGNNYTFFAYANKTSDMSISNITSTWNVSIVSEITDTTFPLISIVYPANNSNTADNGIDVNYTRSDAYLASCWYSNDTWTTNTTLANCANITTVTWSEGQHNVKIWINDTAGNTNSSSVRFTVDTTYPSFSAYWDDNATLTGSGTGKFNVTLKNTNGTVFLRINGTTIYATNLSANVYNVSYAFGSSGTYLYNWTSYGNGTGHNVNISSNQYYTVNASDTTAPTITVTAPVNNSNFNISSVTFNITGSETLSWCGLSISGTANKTMTGSGSAFGLTNSSISDGKYTFIVSCNDTQNNFGYSSSYNFYIDTVFPAINFTAPTPGNGSTQANTNIFVNVTSSDTASNISTFIDFDNSLVGWWRMDDVNATTGVIDYMGCYDNETEILTLNENGEEEWKYFYDLKDGEKVMTLNNESGEKEWQIPVERQIFDNGDNDMYRIELVDENGKESELVVSEEHKVYAKLREDNQTFNNSLKSFVLNTLTDNCFLNLGSFDQIGQFNFNASANIGTSLSCINCLACDSNCSNDSLGIILINLFNSSNISLNCTELILEYFNISDSFFFNSSITYSGVDISNPRKSELTIINRTGLSLKKDINMLVSTTNCIFYQPSFLYLFHIPSLILSPSFKQSSSVSSEFSSILSSFLSNKALLTFSSKNCLIDSEKFNSGNSSNLSFNSLGIDSVMFGIFEPSVYSVEDVDIYKSFGEEDLSNFKLQKITETYKQFENKEEIYFLDSENNPIRVKSITKEQYNGKIYDVDVENDIVLVRRKNSSEIWSGNSNNGTAQGGAVQTSAGKLGKGFSFDGNGDYIESTMSKSFTNGEISFSVWAKEIIDNNGIVLEIYDSVKSLGNNMFYTDFVGSGVRFITYNDSSNYKAYYSDAPSGFSYNKWTYFAGTLNSSDVCYYVYGNGVDTSSCVAIQSGINFTNMNLMIIGQNGLSGYYFNGSIDDVMIFNRSLSADEIKGLYANTSSKYVSNNFTNLLIDKDYIFKAYTQDYGGNVNATELRTVTVNQIPTVTLSAPANGNITTNRTPMFSWSGNDAGGGPSALTYEINLTCWEAGSIVTTGSVYVNKETLGSATSYMPSSYLKCLSDNNQYYNWTVRAYDGVNYSAWATERNISIQSLITISLPVDSINFGSMNNSDAEDTADNSPAPLVLSNDGNAELNITVNFTDLWNSILNPNKYFQFKVRNLTNSCFIYGNSVTSWTNATAPGITGSAIQRLNFTSGYQTGCNNASIDIKIEVPSTETVSVDNEPRSSIITFISSLGEPKQT